MSWRWHWVRAFAGMTLASFAWADTPADYQSHAQIAKGSADTLHRVTLPFEAYRDARENFSDLRVFNAAGESLPFAFTAEPSAVHEEAAPVALPMFPIAAAAQSPGQGVDNLDVLVKSNANGTIVSVQGRKATAKPESKGNPVAWLLDASQLDAPVKSLVFDWNTGAGTEIVRVSIDASEDLKTWVRLVTQAQLVHVEQGGATLEQRRVDLHPVKVKYLRVVGEPAAFTLKSVTAMRLDTVRAPTDRLTLGANSTENSSGQLTFWLGAHVPVEAVKLMLPPNTVAPVTISSGGSGADEKPVFLASTTFYRMVKDGAVIDSPPVEVSPRVASVMYVKAGPNGPPLHGPMQIVVHWRPQQIVFAARGDGPYSLDFGNRNAEQRSLMLLDQLIPGYKAGDDAKIAEDRIVTVTSSAHPPGVVDTSVGEVNLHKLILWATILVAVALLAFMAWRLSRQMKAGGS